VSIVWPALHCMLQKAYKVSDSWITDKMQQHMSAITQPKTRGAIGSTSVAKIEIVLSVLRTISNVRNIWGKSFNDAVSTSQKPSSGRVWSGDSCTVTAFIWRWPEIHRMRFGWLWRVSISCCSVISAAVFHNPGPSPYWNMSSYDHELTFSLTLIKFAYKPIKASPVKRAMRIVGSIRITVLLGIVEHDDLNRQVHLWFESIAGESRGYIGLTESMSNRTWRCVKKFVNPLRSQKW